MPESTLVSQEVELADFLPIPEHERMEFKRNTVYLICCDGRVLNRHASDFDDLVTTYVESLVEAASGKNISPIHYKHREHIKVAVAVHYNAEGVLTKVWHSGEWSCADGHVAQD